MNRKNTILIAVLINAGLLAVLLIAALTTQEEKQSSLANNTAVTEEPFLPFDEKPAFGELPLAIAPEPLKSPDIPLAISEPEPIVHKLPPLIAEPAPSSTPPVAPPMREIIVKKGDTLEKIAKVNGTTVDEIVAANYLKNSFLKIGQVLKIPAVKSLPKALEKVELSPEYYTMKVGDNPWAIAMKHHMKVEELLRLNGLNEERARKLKPGDRLRIR